MRTSSFRNEMALHAQTFTDTLTIALAFRITSLVASRLDNLFIVFFTVCCLLYGAIFFHGYMTTSRDRMAKQVEFDRKNGSRDPSFNEVLIMPLSCCICLLGILKQVLVRFSATLTNEIVMRFPPDENDDPLTADLPIAVLYLSFAFLGGYVIGLYKL